jgi:hypothetical protein
MPHLPQGGQARLTHHWRPAQRLKVRAFPARLARSTGPRFDGAMPRDPYIREKFTKDRTYARKLAAEYFDKFPKDRYQTEVESWRELQSQNIEFTMKRLREPIGGAR